METNCIQAVIEMTKESEALKHGVKDLVFYVIEANKGKERRVGEIENKDLKLLATLIAEWKEKIQPKTH